MPVYNPSPPPHAEPLATIHLFSVPALLLFLECHMSEILQYVALCVWLLSLSMVLLRFIYVVACISTSSLLTAEQHSIERMVQNLFIHPLVDEHLGCSHFLIIINKIALSILCVDVCFHFSCVNN